MSEQTPAAAAPAATPATAPASQLTAREHAALTLRIPASGTNWLDAMINHAVQREAIEGIYRAFAVSRLDETNIGIIRKNGIDAWLKAHSADLEAARKAAEVMIKPQPKAQPKPEQAAAAPATPLSIQS